MSDAPETIRGKAPAYQYYPKDWFDDPALQSCSLYSRGLWHEMLGRMWLCEPAGHLVLNGKAYSTAQLARMVREPEAKVKAALAELENAGVFSKTDTGVIFSRRMLRDIHNRKVRADGGKLGGNPALKVKAKVNHADNLPAETKDNQKLTPSSSSASSSSTAVEKIDTAGAPVVSEKQTADSAVSGWLAVARPKTETEAIAACRAVFGDPVLTAAPDTFIAKCFHHLEDSQWLNAFRTEEIHSFTGYVRKAWSSEVDTVARKKALPQPRGAEDIDEKLCADVLDLWNDIAGKHDMVRSRMAPAITTKRAIGAAFAAFKSGDDPAPDRVRAFKLGTFRIIFSKIASDPQWNGAKGKRAGIEYAVSPSAINSAMERVSRG